MSAPTTSPVSAEFDPEDGVTTATAVIDNGSFGSRTVTFETGRLARQAAGSVVVTHGDTMLLSATTAGRQPKEQFDFFPLTVDVEERMYAAGRIPGSFFRREGRPSEDAILTCRLIDRPLRPTFAKGLRNEVQVVITVLSLDPAAPLRRARDQRRLGVHPAVGPAVLRPGRRHPRRPDQRPVGRLPDPRRARGRRLRHGRGRPRPPRRRRRDHDGRGRGHREDDRADRRWRHRPDRGGRGAGPRGRQAVHQGAVRRAVRAGREGRQAGRRLPPLPRLPGRRLRRRRGPRSATSSPRRSRSPASTSARTPPTRSRTRPRPRWPASSRAARRRSPVPSAR